MRRGYTRGECTHVKRVRMVAPRDRDHAHSVSNSGLDHLRGLSNNLFDRRLREAVRLRQVLGSLQRWRGTPDQRRNARRCGDGLHDWVRSRDSQSSHHRRRTAATTPRRGNLQVSQVKSSQVKSSHAQSSHLRPLPSTTAGPLISRSRGCCDPRCEDAVDRPEKAICILPRKLPRSALDDLEAITRTQNQDA